MKTKKRRYLQLRKGRTLFLGTVVKRTVEGADFLRKEEGVRRDKSTGKILDTVSCHDGDVEHLAREEL